MARNTTQTPDSPAFSRTSRLVRSWQEQLQGTTLGFGPQTQAQASFHLANQVQLQRQTSQPALAFAIEPPALVEYSNSTGATIHCRAQLSLGPGQQQQQIPTISWRLVNTANPHQWDELELPMERTTTKSGQKKSDGLTRRARFVRQDGALMLAPFAAEQYEPDLHSASYRCCLAPSAATSYAGDFPPSTICSRLVRTRAVIDSHVELLVYDKLTTSRSLVVMRCQAHELAAQQQLDFTGWLKDDKPLQTIDEAKLLRRLSQQSSSLLTRDSQGQQDLARYLSTSRGELIIRNASRQLDAGAYKCRARHKLTGRLLTSSQPGRLSFIESGVGEESAHSTHGLNPNATSAYWSTLLMAQENSDVSMCAEFAYLKQPLQMQMSSSKKFVWFKMVDGQRVALEQLHPPLLFKQVDSCLVLGQVQAKQAGQYVCDMQPQTEATPQVSQRRGFTLLVGPLGGKFDVQLAVGRRQQQSAVRLAHVVASGGSGQAQTEPTIRPANQQVVHFGSVGASLELNCSIVQHQQRQQLDFRSGLSWLPTRPDTIAWFKDSKLLFVAPLQGGSLVHTSSDQDSTAQKTNANIKLLQPNVISIDPFGLQERGLYQCAMFDSAATSSSSQSLDSDVASQLADFLLDSLLTSSSISPPRGGHLKRDQLKTSEEFRREFLALEQQLARQRQLLSVAVSMQLDLLVSRPQIVQKFPSTSSYQSDARMSLECVASGLPAPRIVWFLDDFVLDGQGVQAQGDPSLDSAQRDDLLTYTTLQTARQSSTMTLRNLYSGETTELNWRAFLNELPNDEGRFRVSSRLVSSPNQNQHPMQSSSAVVVSSQLSVSGLQLADSGQYKCLAMNRVGQAYYSGRVSVLPLMEPTGTAQTSELVKLRHYQPTNVTLVAGQNASLHCPLVVASGSPVQRVDWFHLEQRLPTSHRQRVESLKSTSSGTGAHLHLENVDPNQDAGVYTCQVSLAGESSLSSSVRTQNHEATPAGSSQLDLYNLTNFASNNLKPATGLVRVSVHVPPLIDVQSLPEFVQVTEGMRTKLVCSIVQGDHPIEIKWIRRAASEGGQSNKTTQQSVIKLANGRHLVGYELMQNVPSDSPDSDNELTHQDLVTLHNFDDSCLLTFRQISHLDAGDYICLAQNKLSVSMRQVRVVVNVAPIWSMEPPGEVHILPGQRLQLDCLAHGQPQPTASWRRTSTLATIANSPTSSDKQQQFVEFVSNFRQRLLANGSLVIDQVEQADGGVFMCEQSNGIGSGLSKLVRVHVQIPPHFSLQTSQGVKQNKATGRLGGPVELKCLAEGEQPMLVGWRQDSTSEVIDLRSDKRRQVTSELKFVASQQAQQQQLAVLESILNITNLSRQDSGPYSCIASNEFGTEELRLELLVQEPPEEPQLMRPIKTESRQATLSFKQPFDGNSPIRKYAIHYRQVVGEFVSPASNSELNATGQANEWRQLLVEAPQLRNFASLDKSTSSDEDQLVHLNLCCLKPFTRYAVCVAALNDIGQSELSKPAVKFQTEEEAIGGPPLDVGVEPTGAHSLKVRWREPARPLQNGLIRGYYIGYRALVPLTASGLPGFDSTQATGQQLDTAADQYQYKNVQTASDLLAHPSVLMHQQVNSSTGDHQEEATQVTNHQQQLHSTYLTNLRRKTTYSIIVQAYNKIGAGPRSDQIIVSTLDAAPPMSPVLKLLAVSHNSAQFAWFSRRFSNSVSPSQGSAGGDGKSQAESGQQALAIQHETPAIDDDDPLAYCTINYKLDDRYFQPQHLSAGMPDQLATSHMAQPSSNNEWQQKRLTRASLSQQQSTSLDTQSQSQRRTDAAPSSFVLQNLRCGSVYLAYMTATNSLGQSEPGETIKFNTRGAAPSAPQNSQDFLQINSTYLVLRLQAWNNAGCPISSFLIRYKLASQAKWTILEHQVYPTTQTITIAGTSVFSTRPQTQSQSSSSFMGQLLMNSQQILSEAQQLKQQDANAQQQQRLSDFILRNLMADSNYKLIVEANSEAGSTLAEFDFETGNFTSSLLAVNVQGLIASNEPLQPQDVSSSSQFSGNGAKRLGGFIEDNSNQLQRASNSLMNSFSLGGANSAGGIWQTANKQTLGVWSLTVVFVAASSLMAIATLALGFKSLLRMKHSSPRGGPDSSSSDGLVSALFCCSTSSSSAASSAGSSNSSSGGGCYQMTSEAPLNLSLNLGGGLNGLQYGHAESTATTGPLYCSLPLAGANQNHLTSNSGHYHSNHLTLESPVNGNSGAELGTISGLLRNSEQEGPLEMSLACGGQLDSVPYRNQMVSSASLSAMLNGGSSRPLGQAQIYASNASRHALTLAPLNRINRMNQSLDQQQQQIHSNTMRINSNYAATLGRQQHQQLQSTFTQPIQPSIKSQLQAPPTTTNDFHQQHSFPAQDRDGLAANSTTSGYATSQASLGGSSYNNSTSSFKQPQQAGRLSTKKLDHMQEHGNNDCNQVNYQLDGSSPALLLEAYRQQQEAEQQYAPNMMSSMMFAGGCADYTAEQQKPSTNQGQPAEAYEGEHRQQVATNNTNQQQFATTTTTTTTSHNLADAYGMIFGHHHHHEHQPEQQIQEQQLHFNR